MASEALPGWFRSEVMARLDRGRRVAGSAQHYARCPAHDDQTASLAIKPGDKVPIIYRCHAGCEDWEVRRGLASAGIPEEYLGVYGTPEFEAARARKNGPSKEQGKLDEIAGLLNESITPAMLKVCILAIIEGCAVPSDRRGFVEFAARAGVKQSQRYDTWTRYSAGLSDSGEAQVLSGALNPQPVSFDHVVLASPADSRQASQVTRSPPSKIIPVSGKTGRRIPETGMARHLKIPETGKPEPVAGLVA